MEWIHWIFRKIRNKIKPYKTHQIEKFVQKYFERRGYVLLPPHKFETKFKIQDDKFVRDLVIFETKVQGRKYPICIRTNEFGDVIKWDWILPNKGFIDMRDIS